MKIINGKEEKKYHVHSGTLNHAKTIQNQFMKHLAFSVANTYTQRGFT